MLLLVESSASVWSGTVGDSWADWFNLVQIGLLTVALLETWVCYLVAERFKRPGAHFFEGDGERQHARVSCTLAGSTLCSMRKSS